MATLNEIKRELARERVMIEGMASKADDSFAGTPDAEAIGNMLAEWEAAVAGIKPGKDDAGLQEWRRVNSALQNFRAAYEAWRRKLGAPAKLPAKSAAAKSDPMLEALDRDAFGRPLPKTAVVRDEVTRRPKKDPQGNVLREPRS